MEKTVKVRTVIGVVVEMPESIYEGNKNIYTLVEDETKTENIKTEPTRAQIINQLKELNVEFNGNAKKDFLETLLAETLAKIEAEKQNETPETETKIEDETKTDEVTETSETEVQTTDLQPEANTAETNITNTAM